MNDSTSWVFISCCGGWKKTSLPHKNKVCKMNRVRTRSTLPGCITHCCILSLAIWPHFQPHSNTEGRGLVRGCKRLLEKASQTGGASRELQPGRCFEHLMENHYPVSPSLPNTQTAYIAIFTEGTKGMKEREMQFLLRMICNAHVWTSQGRGEICGQTPSFLLRAPAHLPPTLPRIQESYRPRFTASRRRKRGIPLNLLAWGNK